MIAVSEIALAASAWPKYKNGYLIYLCLGETATKRISSCNAMNSTIYGTVNQIWLKNLLCFYTVILVTGQCGTTARLTKQGHILYGGRSFLSQFCSGSKVDSPSNTTPLLQYLHPLFYKTFSCQ